MPTPIAVLNFGWKESLRIQTMERGDAPLPLIANVSSSALTNSRYPRCVPAVMSQGETLEELQEMIRDAYRLIVGDATESTFVPKERQEMAISLSKIGQPLITAQKIMRVSSN